MGKNGLMLNYDPLETMKVICLIPESTITWESYKECYEKTFFNGKIISNQHIDAHVYLCRQFGFLKSVNKYDAKYYRTEIIEQLCKNMDTEYKTKKWKKKLGVALLISEKKDHFKKFINFIQDVKSEDEVRAEFGNQKYRTLKAWCIFANLVIFQDKHFRPIPKKINQVYNLEQFWEILVKTYASLQRTNIFEPKKTYIPIEELRSTISFKMCFEDIDKFDYYLTKILRNKKYSFRVKLYGAPAHAYEQMNKFEYYGKGYLLMSINLS